MEATQPGAIRRYGKEGTASGKGEVDALGGGLMQSESDRSEPQKVSSFRILPARKQGPAVRTLPVLKASTADRRW